MRDVHVAGVGMTSFGRHLDRPLHDLAGEATLGALADAGMSADAVDQVVFSNAAAGLITGQEMIRGQVALRDTGLRGVPIINVENACASGSSALHLAWMAVSGGHSDIAMVVGAEKLFHTDKQRSFDAILSGTDLIAAAALSEQTTSGSVMMGVYASEAQAYFDRTGSTARDLASVAVQNRQHASRNPLAQFRAPISVDDVLASRQVAGPLTLLMCSPLTDGAAAIVVCSTDVLQGRDAPRILASTVGSGRNEDAEVVGRVAHAAFEDAGVGPDDLDVAELHDAAAIAQLLQIEQVGLAGHGEAAKFVASGETVLGGRIPLNTSGGLLSRGHALGATGCAQVIEIVDQLRGRAGDRQVDGARVGLAVNAGGWLGHDYAAAVATILTR